MAGDLHGCANDCKSSRNLYIFVSHIYILLHDINFNFDDTAMFELRVEQEKIYFLRIVNANLISQMFMKVAKHIFTVVAVDAGYTNPYITELLVIAPSQNVDVLLKADQPVGSYYMAASAYVNAEGIPFDNSTTKTIVLYASQDAHHPVNTEVCAEAVSLNSGIS